jgi:sucrose-6F-phosphate phosphohydrolase
MTNSDNFLLISDLDDTLLGDDSALERFSHFRKSLGERLTLVFASGRFYESIQRDVETTLLPAPIMVIGGVGSEIRGFPDGQFNGTWIERIANHWSTERARQVLSGIDGLELQPDQCQSDFKLSYFYRQATADQLADLQQLLATAGIESEMIYSSERDLDFLPRGVDKGSAAKFVAGYLGFPDKRVLVAGNSGNDVSLFAHGFGGIVVGNAHQELKHMAENFVSYQARMAYADGVREGIEYWMSK